MRKALTTGAGLVALVTVLACGAGSNADGDGADIVDEPENGTTETAPAGDDDADSGDAPGTRQNPLDPGVAFTVGDWEVEFDTTNTDASDIVAAENQFNDPPAEGRQFVMVEVTFTYAGDDSGQPWLDLQFSFYGADGNTFGSALTMDDDCGVIPNDLHEIGEMFPDASSSANVCVSAPSDQIDGGAWIVEDTFSLDSDRTFAALE